MENAVVNEKKGALENSPFFDTWYGIIKKRI